MRDPEFVAIRNRLLIAIVVALVFSVPLLFIFINRFSSKDTAIMKEIKKDASMVILVTDNTVKNENEINNLIKEVNISHYKVNVKDNKYNDLLDTIKILEKDIVPPTVIYIKDGDLVASLVDINNTDDLELFLENYGLK